jgi:prevent-host-death family protein
MPDNYKLNSTVKTVNEFRESFSSSIEEVNKNKQPLLLTQNEKPTAVMIDIQSYNQLTANYEVIEDILEGLKDSISGRTHSTEDLKKHFNNNYKLGEFSFNIDL